MLGPEGSKNLGMKQWQREKGLLGVAGRLGSMRSEDLRATGGEESWSQTGGLVGQAREHGSPAVGGGQGTILGEEHDSSWSWGAA